MILPLSSSLADLQTAGGKGANLAKLSQAGFRVPPGFIVTTTAYRQYVAANDLQPHIQAALADLDAWDATALEAASSVIRAAFAAGSMPAEMADALREAYADLGGGPVAVRSSATAEDLPDLSFAGQQDTYLNVVGAAQVIGAVQACWGSLWTARAIGYRARNDIPHLDAELAVIVQRMVDSDVSGVLFTANPLTGLLSESVVDATFGLGEALVSGQVEPDQFVVSADTGVVVSQTLGAKGIATRPRPRGGVEIVAEGGAAKPSLSAEQLQELVLVGRQIQAACGAPQDIEWAYAAGVLHILQARPITSLFPVPRISRDPLVVWFSFGAVQGLVGPMTPLGQDVIRTIMAGLSTHMGVPRAPEQLRLLAPAGERLWAEVSGLIRHPLGARVAGGVLAFVEPSVGQIMQAIMADPRAGAGTGRLRLSTVWRVARFFVPIAAGMIGVMRRPARGRARFEALVEAELASIPVLPDGSDRFARLASVAAFLRHHVAGLFPFALPRFISVFGPGMGSLTLLSRLSGNTNLALEVTRGMPGNVTTIMDLALWRTAQAIKGDKRATAAFREMRASALAGAYLGHQLPPAAQAAVADFVKGYGMRGVGEIDLGQPRWREDPTPVMQTLQSYLEIEPGSAPDVLFARGEQAALQAIEDIAAAVRRQRAGRLKERIVRAAARRMRLLLGLRESPKFFIVRTLGVARAALLEVGREFVAAGTFDAAEDLAFLRLAELEALAREGDRPETRSAVAWREVVAARRSTYERERRRRQVPRVLVSDGRAFYDGIGAENDTDAIITGSPVSAGVVEGSVRVMLDPHSAQLAPGEILVCPGTDPAWTPLFMAAGGLITEVGGMMTHGSVVAREVGIPAVVGVHMATTRLRNGQRVRLDGTTGQVTLLD